MEKQMSIIESYMNFWKKAFVMKGRARRREFWIPFIVHAVIRYALKELDHIPNVLPLDKTLEFSLLNILPFLFELIIFIPSVTNLARRLQDIKWNGQLAWIPKLMSLFLTLSSLLLFVKPMEDFGIPMMFAFQLIALLSLLMTGIILAMNIIDGTHGPNKYGEDPKQRQPIDKPYIHGEIKGLWREKQ